MPVPAQTHTVSWERVSGSGCKFNAHDLRLAHQCHNGTWMSCASLSRLNAHSPSLFTLSPRGLLSSLCVICSGSCRAAGGNPRGRYSYVDAYASCAGTAPNPEVSFAALDPADVRAIQGLRVFQVTAHWIGSHEPTQARHRGRRSPLQHTPARSA